MKTQGQIKARIKLVADVEKSDLAAIQLRIDALDGALLAEGDAIEEEESEQLHAQSAQISAKWQAYISALEWVLE